MARKKQRETYGNGSITPKLDKSGKQMTDKQGLPLWLVCLSLGSETVIGEDGKKRKKRRKAQRVAHGTLAEARKLAKGLSAQYEHIDVTAAREMTFSDACNAWEKPMRNAATATEGAMNGYLQNLGHMRGKIGYKALTAIVKQDVEDALAGIKEERGLSNTTMNKVYAVTKRVFAYCVDSDWLVRNPCDKVKAPKIDEVTNRRSLTAEECAVFRARIDAAEDEAIAEFEAKEARAVGYGTTFGRKLVRGVSGLSCLMAIRIELATGLRRSEVLGLTWSAVDFETGQITVRQKLVCEKKRNERKPGFRDEIGFPGLCMHELRHTQATLLLGNGVDLKTVQARMGHARSSHTLDLYAHAIPANDAAAADIMGSITGAPAQASATVVQLDKTA